MKQPQLFETEDQYGNDIIQGPKLPHTNLTFKQKLIDPSQPPNELVQVFPGNLPLTAIGGTKNQELIMSELFDKSMRDAKLTLNQALKRVGLSKKQFDSLMRNANKVPPPKKG